MRWTTALAATVLMLGACEKPAATSSSDHNVTIVVPGANGGSVVIGNQAPANLPAYVKVFPGAKVTASTTTPKGGVLVLEVNAPPEAVMDFYKKSAADAGLTSTLDSWSMEGSQHTGAHVVMFGVQGGSKSLTATVEAKGGATKVGLMYGQS
jgi:tripartite-type tricarboxylate transporter receptor subunit TctC